MKNHLTDEQKTAFDEAMKYYQAALNLHDWRLHRGSKPAPNGTSAIVEMHDSARMAIYRIGDFGALSINEKSIHYIAAHESCHMLLRPLIVIAQDRSATAEQIEAAEHAIIHVIVNILTGGL